ncbi:hypothetical protein [Acanthamoeba polyphaga mimivirus]|nr:hypothetical protein [Acanthamoeba castellanii mamavirus]EJN40615.1 hypothetical protein lvs_L666 [Acanthamoeba polyphaga lentillevirus]UMZ07686.1 hypothetical protein [Acanthamoeba polyphaga mimivirus]
MDLITKFHLKNNLNRYNSFLEKAIKIHGNQYSYNKVYYITREDPVLILCNSCELSFLITPKKHLNKDTGQCPNCFPNKKQLRELQFIQQLLDIYGNQFDYSKISYQNSKYPVSIICTGCKFLIKKTPFELLRKKIHCPKCEPFKEYDSKSVVRCKITTQEFIKRAKERHGDRYDYSKTEYISMDDFVTIKCNNCNTEFNKKPKHHLKSVHKCCYVERKSVDKNQSPTNSHRESILEKSKIITEKNTDNTQIESQEWLKWLNI